MFTFFLSNKTNYVIKYIYLSLKNIIFELTDNMIHDHKWLSQVADEKFSVLLEYLEGLQGAAKDTTVKKALALVEESGQAPEDKDVQQRAHRAREVIQLLS